MNKYFIFLQFSCILHTENRCCFYVKEAVKLGKTYLERQAEVPVLAEADVVVVGGGSAGTAGAIAAARAGAKTVLIERYGQLGGMPTGGEVILIPSLSSGGTVMIRGVMLEIMERLTALDGVCGPDVADTGKIDADLLEHWSKYFNMTWDGQVCYGGYVDPDLMKIVLSHMMEEAGVELYLHSWGCKAICEDGAVKGVLFESKEGRAAILGKVVVDCTGDGDIFASAGAEFEVDRSSLSATPGNADIVHDVSRTASLAVVYRLGGADFEKFADFGRSDPEALKNHEAEMNRIAGYAMKIFPTSRNDVVWVDNWLLGYSSLKVKDLTAVETDVRRTLLDVMEYVRAQKIPGLENIWLYDTAPQLGTRGSRRVIGTHRLTLDDLYGRRSFDDVIAVIPSTVNPRMPQVPSQIPLGVLIPKAVGGLLVAGRCFSSELEANSYTNLVPHCFAYGQAAGVAAAVAAADGVEPRAVDVKKVQSVLREQDVYLG
ncbi:MAG: FAD-dependent oxidoreductase [Clostridia bacterium]|nr:FAD-dependent oxidoreductase [Clostridia bacterium]